METILITDMTAEKYSIAKEPGELEEFARKHEGLTSEQLMKLYFMRTKTCKIFMQRLEDAREVIDLIAEELQMTDNGHYLYAPLDDQTPIVDKIRQYLDRGGDKVKLKKRNEELEKENVLLRSLINK